MDDDLADTRLQIIAELRVENDQLVHDALNAQEEAAAYKARAEAIDRVAAAQHERAERLDERRHELHDLLRQVEHERDELRAALEQVRKIVTDAEYGMVRLAEEVEELRAERDEAVRALQAIGWHEEPRRGNR